VRVDCQRLRWVAVVLPAASVVGSMSLGRAIRSAGIDGLAWGHAGANVDAV